jgi:large subunit ribosomal protein L10
LAISKERKKQMVADYVDKMSRSEALILADYRGLTVADLTELRRRLREVGGVYQIVKNTLFKRALEEAGIAVTPEQMDGPIAVGYCFEDSPPVAKALTTFARETQILKVQGAIMGSSLMDAEGVKALADLPSRDVLQAQLVGAVQGPMSGLASIVTAPMRELVQVLQARSEQGQEAAA